MNNGISALVMVTQLKSSNANEEALEGADKQRSLVQEQKLARAKLRTFEDLVGDNDVTAQDRAAIQSLLGELGLDSSVNLTNTSGTTAQIDEGGTGAVSNNAKEVDNIRARFEDHLKDLEADDKMGNFEIQDLMSRFNQSETLASSVLKKKDDTAGGVIQKVG